MISRLRLLWRALRARGRFESELEEELAFHVRARSDDLVAAGLSPEQARRQARIELGMREMQRDACRRARGLEYIDRLVGDLRFALRGLRRHRSFSLTALAVLGIALTANAVLFTLFSAYALRSPPVSQPDRWVTLEAVGIEGQRLALWRETEADALLRSPPSGLDQLYSLRETRLTVEADVVRPASGEAVSDNYFGVLGIPALRGRTFDATAAQSGEIVLSHLGWQRLLGAREDVLGQRITLAGQPHTVIGVMPPEFTGTTPLVALYWMRESDYRRLQRRDDGELPVLEISGLREPQAAPEVAAQALTVQALTWNATREEGQRIERATVSPRSGYLPASDARDLVLACLPIGLAFVLVLMVAAANLANLVLARFAARRHELATRVAVGASRRRVLAQLLTECLLLSGLATVLALAASAVLLRPLQSGLFALMGDFGIDLIPLELDLAVVLWTAALATLATLAFGAVPAWLATASGAGRSGASESHALRRPSQARLRAGLMVAQIAVSVVLLVLSGLIAMNARRVDRTDPGFDVARTIAVHPWQTTPALVRELAALPEVEAVAVASRAPLMGSPHRADARIDARSEPLFLRAVDAAYFDVLELELLRGRRLHRGDEPDARVAVVSRRTAERLWPDAEPIGRYLELPAQDALGSIAPGRYEVVGVVQDVVSAWFVSGIDASAVYLPTGVGASAVGSVLLRTRDTSPATREAITRACLRAAPDQNCELMPMLDAVRVQRLPFLIAATVASALGWIALAISCLGLYGLMSYLVVQKRREIGVRLALGASQGRVTTDVLGVAARQIALGLAIGLPLAFAVSRLVAAYTDQLRTFDPVSFGLVPALLGAIALFAAWLPARRSGRIAPNEALRHE